MIYMLPIPILLVLEITLVQIWLIWNKFHCTVQYSRNYQPWQHLLMDPFIEGRYCINFKVFLLSPTQVKDTNAVEVHVLIHHIVMLCKYHCYKCLLPLLAGKTYSEQFKNIDFEALIIVSIWINANSFDVCKEGKCLVAPKLIWRTAFKHFTSSSSRLE